MANYNPKTLVLEKDGNTYNYASGPFYAECSTAAETQTKTVTISEIKELNAGLSVRIKFTNAQTYNGQPKLQINSLAIKNIVRNGTTAAERYEWNSGEILDFVYDGTNFIIQEGAIPTTTYYGSRIKLSSDTNSTSEALAATPKAVKTAYDLANGLVSTVNGLNDKKIEIEFLGSMITNGTFTHESITAYDAVIVALLDQTNGATHGTSVVPTSVYCFSTDTAAIGVSGYNNGRIYAYSNFISDTSSNAQVSTGYRMELYAVKLS